MNRCGRLAILVTVALFCAETSAETPAPERGLRVMPAATLGAGNSFYSFQLWGTNDRDFSSQYSSALWGTGETFLEWGITDFVDVGGSIPLHMDKLDSASETAQGDTKLFAKMIYPPYPHSSFFDLGFYGGFSLPTGSRAKGLFSRKFTNDTYAFSSGDIDVTVLVLGVFDFRKMRNIAPFSIRFNVGEEFTGRASQDDFYRLGVGATFFLGPRFEWLVEGSGETKAISGISPAHDPLRFSSGARFRYRDFDVTIGGDFSLSATNVRLSHPNPTVEPTKVQPKYAVSLSLSYLLAQAKPSDPDSDGVFGKADQCPEQPEDFDDHLDNDGCPDRDNDADGILDAQDKCPNRPEDNDGYNDEDGCPDLDNDGDGVLDSLDDCTGEKEDVDGFEDKDGCPDLDNDGDGIPDIEDKCPNQPEDRDGHEDHDGCQDIDNDADGIPDSLDKCPGQKEQFNGYHDQDGCPDHKPKEIGKGRTILGNVRFPQGSALWVSGSAKELDALSVSLKAYPKITIAVHGHTDSFGSRTANQQLSEKMARAVMDYLIKKGVGPERIAPQGFGESKPIAPNTTSKGRELNRRIEILRAE